MAKPREIYMIYMRGFRRGATYGAIDRAAVEHDDEDIRCAWNMGYLAGRDALRVAEERAQELSGYQPSILRTQGGDVDETLHDASVAPATEDDDVLGAVGIILRSIEEQSGEQFIRLAAGGALLLLDGYEAEPDAE